MPTRQIDYGDSKNHIHFLFRFQEVGEISIKLTFPERKIDGFWSQIQHFESKIKNRAPTVSSKFH